MTAPPLATAAMTSPQLPPPRKRTWPAFATVGFFAGIVTVLVAVTLWKWFGR